MPISAEVLVAEQIPDDEVTKIKGEFASIGLTIDLRTVTPKRSLTEVAWLVLAAFPVQHFFSRLSEDFADDVHDHFRSFVNRLLSKKLPEAQSKPKLVLQDTVSSIQIVLEQDLPIESYRQLLSLDLTAVQHGSLHYDVSSQQWRSET